MLSILKKQLASALVLGAATGLAANAQGVYVKGDFHQHTTYTDGSYTFGKMMTMNNKFGLDWWANSEHGGGFSSWGLMSGLDIDGNVLWKNTSVKVLGKPNNGNMWRWQSLSDFSFPDLLQWRKALPNKLLIQAYEMNVPGHEHASMGLIANQFDAIPDVEPLAQFEYMFDNSDKDDTSPNGWKKSTKSGHEKAIEAVTWLQTYYPKQSWVIPAHPERYKYNGSTGWNINHFRDLNDAAPDVFFGFESVPGHQKGSNRGEYGSKRPSYGIETYGGAGWMCARVGGLWDAMLSEGRHFWLFANSDCHNNELSGADFFPGEYQKNYTFVAKKMDAQAVADGLRSGNNWIVMGDLIDSLVFNVDTAKMGSTLKTDKTEVTVTIRLRDPESNNFNRYSNYTNPEIDHVDIIAGVFGPKALPVNVEAYNKDTVLTTKVIARFGKAPSVADASNIITQPWTAKSGGWKEMSMKYSIKKGDKLYFRLRGSNVAVNTPGETDASGNPLMDTEGENTPEKAFADLWFYSNPIFVEGIDGTNVPEGINAAGEMTFSISPNPSSDIVNVSFASNQSGEIRVCDIAGAVVYKNKVSGNNASFSVADWSKGIYNVTVNNATQRLLVK